MAFNIIILEFSVKDAVVAPLESSSPVLLPLMVLPIVYGTIWPSLHAFPVLFVFFPLPFISGSVSVHVHSLAMSFIVLPFAFIDITVGVDQSAFSVGFVLSPVALIERTIRPDLEASSISDFGAFEPFSLVLGVVFDRVEGFPVSALLICIWVDFIFKKRIVPSERLDL